MTGDEMSRGVICPATIGMEDVEYARPIDPGGIHGMQHTGRFVEHARHFPVADMAVEVDDGMTVDHGAS
ncbi:MAG TPA: hypothetical protein DIC52_01565 [Candidatus Latescibacteria bacterium]|nr:hypothetical protein [Candidatus Latescibacterota bacterium]